MSGELKKEILGIGLLGVFIFLLASLTTYHPLDPSFNTLAEGAAKNLCGKAGSYISDILIQLFGMVSYFLPAVTLLFSLFYLRKKDPPHIIVLSSGLVLLFLSLSVILQLLAGTIQVKGVAIPFSGFVGVLLERSLVKLF